MWLRVGAALLCQAEDETLCCSFIVHSTQQIGEPNSSSTMKTRLSTIKALEGSTGVSTSVAVSFLASSWTGGEEERERLRVRKRETKNAGKVLAEMKNLGKNRKELKEGSKGLKCRSEVK